MIQYLKTNALKILGFLCVALSLIGNYFINEKDILGYYLWIISDFLWCFYFYKKRDWPSIVLFGTYLILCFHGVYRWLN